MDCQTRRKVVQYFKSCNYSTTYVNLLSVRIHELTACCTPSLRRRSISQFSRSRQSDLQNWRSKFYRLQKARCSSLATTSRTTVPRPRGSLHTRRLRTSIPVSGLRSEYSIIPRPALAGFRFDERRNGAEIHRRQQVCRPANEDIACRSLPDR